MSLYEDNILSDEKALNKFWAKVEVIHPDDQDACYDWNAKKDKNGCGIFSMHCPQLDGIKKIPWKSFRAPRIMWVLENDQLIPDGMLVIHSCDNESCTNPRHLRLGTHKDNANDRKLRGRFDTGPKGEDHPNAKLTVAQVRKICHLYFNRNIKPNQIAEQLHITSAVVFSIVNGKAWKHVTKTLIPKGYLHKYKRCKIRNAKMYETFKEGFSYREIAKKYKMSYVYTIQILRQQRKLNGDPPTPIRFRSEGRRGKK